MTSKESNFREYILENEEKILRMQRGEIKGRLVLAENDVIRFECETDIPGQLVFHYSVLRWSLSAFKLILQDWFVVLRLLKSIGLTYVCARARPDDRANLKFFEMTGFAHVGDLVNRFTGEIELKEYRLEL